LAVFQKFKSRLQIAAWSCPAKHANNGLLIVFLYSDTDPTYFSCLTLFPSFTWPGFTPSFFIDGVLTVRINEQIVLSETRTGCGVWIGIPDGNVDYKGHATNFNFPYGGAFVYEIWGCVGTVTLKMKVSVIDPSQSFRTNYQKGHLFVPNSILKVSSGKVSRDLNGFYSSTISQNLLIKSPDCMVKLSAKASSGKAGGTVW
jgi:hypothetical protein